MDATADKDVDMSSAEAEQNTDENDESGIEDVSDEDDDGEDDEDDGEEEEDEDESEEEDNEEGDAVEDDEEWDTENDDDDDDDDDEDEMLEVSESDGETGDRCPICLNRFREQDLGTPEACDHAFCLECILEWSKNVNTCPVDRQQFRLIFCRHSGENNVYKRIIVQDRNRQAEEEEDLTYCEVCDQCDREDRLLLCDGCDKGYHLECLTPPLQEVPVNEWFCPECAQRQEEDETVHSRSQRRRQVARTRVMERVRSAIEELRVRRIRNLRQILSSSEDEQEEAATGDNTAATATSTPASSSAKKPAARKPRRKTPRKYKKRKTKTKTKRKRKTTTKKRKTTKRKTTGRKRKGRKGKKKRARTVKQTVPVTTVKSRIAGALGLETPPAGRTIPTQRSKLDKPVDSGSASLSIFGNKEELIHFDDDYGADAPVGRSKYSRSALSSYKPIGRVPVIIPEKKKKIVIKTTPVSTSNSLDILGSIMQDQSKLHMDSKNVKIERDGSLISSGKQAVEAKAQSSKFFKSSFTAVSGSWGPSILNSLSSAGKSSDPNTDVAAEEYDPAFPTEEIEEDIEVKKDNKEDDKYDPAHPTDELDEVSEEEEEMKEEIVQSAKSSHKNVPNKVITIGEFLASESGKKKESKKNKEAKKNAKQDSKKSKVSASGGHSELKNKVKESEDKCETFEIEEDIPLCKDVTVSPTKDKKQESAKKLSPSVKITETGKKVSPTAIKPFEISKKILFEKKRLYGGEIDFTEDVNFSDAGFENFEVNIKAIESVFKGTAKKPDADSKEDKKESEKDRDGVKSSLNDAVNEKVTLPKEKSETTVDLKETETLTVSERFRMLSDDTRDQDIVSLEEEDPIHEMRKLDKELDLELENPDVGKEWHKSKSEIDREHKKSRRKVSIDKEDEVRVRHKKEGKDKKRDWEEVEEGEVEDEHQYRERKRREKRERKKKAAEKERYYNDIDMQFGDLDNPDSEIDTRIVVQVSQNTDSRTVWEEDEKIRKKKDKEEKERRKNKHRDEERSSKKERKRKRRRSRSHSYDSRDKSKSRDRKRSHSRSRERSKRRHRDRSRSRSLERSRKKKKKARDRSRDKHRSRDKSEERVDIFGRSRSPFRRKETSKNKSLSPAYQTKYSAMKNKKSDIEVSLSKKAKLDGEVILIDDDDEEEEEEVDKLQDKSDPRNTHSDDNSVPSTPKEDPEDAQKEEPPSQIEVKESSQRDISSDERDEDYDDEPEETEQFNYTDRDEYLSQNKHKQQHQNLIQVGVDGGSYDPANPTESSSPIAPPLPDGGRVHTPTPPLPPVGEFNPLFPPPPPGPPPPGPPPPTVLIQDRPPVPPQLNGPPGQGIMGDAPPILIRGPPPMEPGQAPGIIHQRPNISVPVNINVVPPGFHRGLPQTIQPQRQIIVNAFRPGMQRMQRLPNPSVPRFGFTTTAEAVTPQFGMPSHPRPGIINGPYEGLPPPSEGQPQNLPPPHSHFPLGGELQPPPQHILPMQADGPPPSNLVHIPVEVEEGTVGLPIRPLGPPISTPDTEPHLIHIGPMSNEPRPRLPIPLLPTSEVPSAMVSIPPPAMSLPPPVMSVPSPGSIPSVPSIPPHMPPHVSPHLMSEEDPYIDSQTPPHNLVKSPEISTHMNNNTTVIPGLDMVEPTEGETHSSIGKSKKSFSQLEEISKLLNTQAKLMLDTKSKNSSDSKKNGPVSKDDGVFKVPFPPGTKSSGNKNEVVETTEVVDMDMASPILEEGNIELPVSPQFDNLIDTDDWLEEVYDNKTKKNEDESEKVEKWEEDEDEDEGEQNNTISELTDKWMEIINNIPKKPIETNDKSSAVLNKPEPKEVKSNKEKVSLPVKVKEKDQETKKDSPKKSVEAKKQSSKENKVKSRQHRKHKHRPEPAKEINLKLKAQVDTELDLDSQELTSAVDMTNKEKYLRKLHLQERVVEEVKMAIKPHYANKKIDKEQYKEIMRKAVPKICHSKSGDINPMKIKSLIEAYVDRFNKPKHSKNDKQEASPAGVKANGERAKVKTAR